MYLYLDIRLGGGSAVGALLMAALLRQPLAAKLKSGYAQKKYSFMEGSTRQ